MRVDKYLWTVRIYKTRSLSTKACSSGEITISGEKIKPSKGLKIGDIVQKRETPILRSFKIIDFPKSRVGAKLVADYITETTSTQDLAQLEQVNKMNSENKKLGIKGRPTKKDRRDLEKFKA